MELVINDQALLRRPCLPVKLSEGRELARKLTAWLERNNRKARRPVRVYDAFGKVESTSRRVIEGLGIAAPQLGVLKRVAVARPGGRPIVLINPRIIRCSKNRVQWPEGCLSFPGEEVETYRPVWVEVVSDNWPSPQLFGPQTPDEWTEGSLLEAVCVQHEIAHLYGLLMFDFTSKDSPDPVQWAK